MTADRILAKPLAALLIGLSVAFLALLLLIGGVLGKDAFNVGAWLVAFRQAEILPYILWSLVLVVLLGLERKQTARPSPSSLSVRDDRLAGRLGTISVGLALFLLAYLAAAEWGWALRLLPPLYHDEYSYLFQAQTFLAGRCSFPEPPASEHFQQTHVICDDGVYASRYFPGTGFWLAPFVAFDFATMSGWIAQGIIACFIGLSVWRASRVAGLWTGLMIAASPGLIVFSQTLLSPHPTMVGLGIGWWAFTRTISTRRCRYAVVAGLAIGFAFVTRPLTAVAIASPWGFFAIKEMIRAVDRRWFYVLVLSFAPAVGMLAWHNHLVMGSVWVTPYGHYIDRQTPSHVYGFFNVTRGHQGEHPDLDPAYDDWSNELDLSQAWVTTADRIGTALPWIGGLFPITLMVVLGVVSIRVGCDLVLLPILSVIGLVAAYFPYFYVGIMRWSYLVEAVPFVLLIAGMGVGAVVRSLRSLRLNWTSYVLLSLPLVMMGVNWWTTLPQAFDPNSEIVLPRLRAAQRRAQEEELTAGIPSIILYDIDRRSDLHTTWVHNDPALRGPILRGWKLDPSDIEKAFPDRAIHLYQGGFYRLLRPANQP